MITTIHCDDFVVVLNVWFLVQGNNINASRQSTQIVSWKRDLQSGIQGRNEWVGKGRIVPISKTTH
jgi:hypothetical protein